MVATLVRATPPRGPARGAVLYVHGYNDYFFQADLARWATERGWAFYALDLRKYGRSLREHQTPNFCSSLRDYDEELDTAAATIAAEGHSRLALMAHSTGGLVLPLWAARRPSLPLAWMILNSPFLDFKQPPWLRATMLPLVRVLARHRPKGIVPAAVSGRYGESLHASRHGSWDYDLRWKPIVSFPIRYAWLAAVADGHRCLEAGIDLHVPVLAMSSTHTVGARDSTEALQRGDVVLDATRIARRACRLGPEVTVVRIPDGIHDLVLSPPRARRATYDTMDRWLAASER